MKKITFASSFYSSDPRKRYQLFLKATQIDKIVDTLNSNAETYESAKQKLIEYEQEVNVVQVRYEKLDEQVKAIKSLEPMKVRFVSFESFIRKLNLSFSL